MPITCFFFGLVHLGLNAVGSRIQLPPWLETQSHIHNQNLWPDAQLHLEENQSQYVCYCSKTWSNEHFHNCHLINVLVK